MSSQAVGFQISGDVVGGGSLVHAATGRLLKALSDGGVDFYAVAATIQLGKMIPITTDQEAATLRLLAERRGSQHSYLHKALSIGWGKTDIVTEISRSKAGIAALRIIGAFAFLQTSTWDAAEAFSTLMELSGCEKDLLPNLDAINGLIKYLRPYLADSSLEIVYEHVVRICSRFLQTIPKPKDQETCLVAKGNGSKWAQTAIHLLNTARTKEHAHLRVYQRGAWFAAFASHTLGMAVVVFCGNEIVWQAAGDNGRALIYLDDRHQAIKQKHNSIIHFTKKLATDFNELRPTIAIRDAFSDALEDLFNYEQGEWRSYFAPSELEQGITSAVLQRALFLVKGKTRDVESINVSPLSTAFYWLALSEQDKKIVILQELRNLGMAEVPVLNDTSDTNVKHLFEPNELVKCHMKLSEEIGWSEHNLLLLPNLLYLPGAILNNLLSICPPAKGLRSSLCSFINRLIEDFVVVALVLAQCHYDCDKIRINPVRKARLWDIFSTAKKSSIHQISFVYDYLTFLTSQWAQIEVPNFSNDAFRPFVLAQNNDGVIVYLRPLIYNEVLGKGYRLFGVSQGSIAVDGVLRDKVIATDRSVRDNFSDLENCETNLYCSGSLLTPVYATGPLEADMIVVLRPDFVSVRFRTIQNADSTNPLVWFFSFSDLMTGLSYIDYVGAPCGHPRDSELVVDDEISPSAVCSLGHIPQTDRKCPIQVRFFAVFGYQLAQLVQIAVMTSKQGLPTDKVLQGHSCLACLLKKCKHMKSLSIIMT